MHLSLLIARLKKGAHILSAHDIFCCKNMQAFVTSGVSTESYLDRVSYNLVTKGRGHSSWTCYVRQL